MNKFVGIQFLRGFAASLVMFLHIFQKLEIQPFGNFFISGQYSVDIFFILSGFLIFLTVNNGTNKLQYLKKRLFRIYPMYLFSLVFYLLYSVFYLGNSLDYLTLLQNVLMLPWNEKWSYDSLIVGVAWSTMFEMMFYFLFFIILLFNLDKKKIFILIPTLFVVSKLLFYFNIINYDTPFISLVFSILSTKYVFLFLVGCLISYLYVNDKLPVIGKKLYNVLLISSILIFIFTHCFKYNIVVSLFTSTFLFLTMLFVDKYYQLNMKNKFVKFFSFLGDISFSIYLIHILIIKILINVFDVSNVIEMIVLTSILTIIISSITYQFIEKKFIALAKK